MYNIERQEKILEILKEKKSCSVAELAKQLLYSEATIRRDLKVLEDEMKIRKTFGGAMILETYPTEIPVMIRRQKNSLEKKKICREAAPLVRDNMTIFLAASTTVEHLVPYLNDHKGLTVITNSPDIPAMLSSTDAVIYNTGGRFLHQSNSFIGEYARKMLRGINADLMFFSVRGMSENGKLTTSSTEDDVMSVMIENAAKTCLLIDSSKFNKTYPFTLCSIQDIDIVATDKPLPETIKHDNLLIAK